MHKIFSFKGVVRNTDNMLADEGECLEVMNMRIKDGSLVPVGRPVDVAALGYAYSRILLFHAGCISISSPVTLLREESSPHTAKR